MKFLVILLFLIQGLVWADTCTLEVRIEGTIGPGTVDYLERATQKADQLKCDSFLVLINTPGGNLESTRMIVERILNSTKPYLCLVAPNGAHAGSAGAIILQACHINGALKATNLGAATPIMGTGQDMSKDLRKKIINDTVSWLEGITKLRNRNLDFSKKIVTHAKAVSSEEAYKIKAIDILADDVKDFLAKAKELKTFDSNGQPLDLKVGEIKVYNTDSRYQILQIVSDPQISYLLFMGSMALLYFEFTHPGTIVPGVLGAMGLVLSLISFHKLEVWWGGLALIVLSLVFFILEAFVPSFGMLGIGGIVSLVLGGLFLFDSTATGYSLPLWTILPSAVVLGLIMLGIGWLMYQTKSRRVRTGSEEMIGRSGKVRSLKNSRTGQVKVFGEIWSFESEDDVGSKDEVVVLKVQGLKLIVKKKI